MKNIRKIVTSFLVIGFMSLNIIFSLSTSSNKNSLTLQNLNALQASAGELYCDQTTNNLCVIWEERVGSGTVIVRSTGGAVYAD